MSRIELFRQHLREKRAVKVIAGIDNFDIENIKKVVISANESGASAIDICADADIIREVRSMTELPLFVSSVKPEELVQAVELGADAIELGNFDALYKKGASFSAEDVLSLVHQTIDMLGDNRGNSQDGRYWGLLKKDRFIGRAVTIFWPPRRIKKLWQ